MNRVSEAFHGTNGTAPDSEDKVITGAYKKTLIGSSHPTAGQVLFEWNLLESEANGKAIKEFGLLCADGTLFARRTRTKALEKENDISIEGEWLIIF